jgi:hypothetical protein
MLLYKKLPCDFDLYANDMASLTWSEFGFERVKDFAQSPNEAEVIYLLVVPSYLIYPGYLINSTRPPTS